jgi:hypothetical protein
MRRYMFAIPGGVGYEYIQATNLKAAENIANEMCRDYSFLGGPVQPLVTEVGKTYAQSK